MPITPSEITSRMRANLRATEPELDTSAGSVTRKMLDAVAEMIAESYADEHLLTYQYDLEAHYGNDLDDLVGNFGITRYAERRATGVLTFERNNPADRDIFIPIGTQAATTGQPPVIAATTNPAVLREGEDILSVPARMLTAGTRGNVGTATISRMVTAVNGITGVTNTAPFSGGRDAESDSALRRRFRLTIFQNLAGTGDFYLGLALDDEDSTSANIVGASKRYREQIEVVSGSATSQIPDATDIYAGTESVGANIDQGDFLTEGVHYSFDSNVNPPVLTSLDSEAMPDGVYDLEFDYEPQASRNDVSEGITNRVDIYVHGYRPVTAIDSLVFRSGQTFNNTTSSPLYRQNFQREDGSAPRAGNHFLRYGFSPVTNPSVEGTIVIGNNIYEVGVDAFLVNDITTNGLAPRSRSGVELVAQANGGPITQPDGTSVAVEYVFNEIPRSITAALERFRLLTTDVLVHQAKPIWLNLNFAVILLPGFSASAVRDDLFSALEEFISRSGFSNELQTSDLLGVAKGVTGVDAIRFLTQDDNAQDYGIQRVANDRETVLEVYDDASGRAVTVLSTDDELPALNKVTLSVRAMNTYYQGQ